MLIRDILALDEMIESDNSMITISRAMIQRILKSD